MSPDILIQLDWFFKLLITSAVGVIGFFLNRTLNRIEGKLDTYAAVQAEHDKVLGVFENRVTRMESDIRELRAAVKELSEGVVR